MERKREYAIIRKPEVGVIDYPYPCLHFYTENSDETTTAHTFSWSESGSIIVEANVDDIKKMDGWPCIVERWDDGIRHTKFIRLTTLEEMVQGKGLDF